MKLPSAKAIAFNAAAVCVIGVAAVTQVKSWFHVPVTANCTERYHKAVAMGVDRNGTLLSAADIQAAAGGADHGVMQNLSVTRITGGPGPAALTVSMPAGSNHPDHAREPRGGVVFPWQPRALAANVAAACLSYDLLLPANFDFGSGVGTLPGLGGASAMTGAAKNERFTVHFGWSTQGFARIKSVMSVERRHDVGILESQTKIPRGRWVRVDQEIVLNSPGVADGTLRLWLEGALVSERQGFVLRESADTTVEKILADAYFGASTTGSEGRAAKDESVQFTPFEVRW